MDASSPLGSAAWLVGLVGLVLIEGSYVPQLWRLSRVKNADGLSLMFPAMNLFGRLLAFGFAMSQHQAVFSVGFAVGMLLRLTLLLQIAWYRRLANRTWVQNTISTEPGVVATARDAFVVKAAESGIRVGAAAGVRTLEAA